jgi:hypothetical protein
VVAQLTGNPPGTMAINIAYVLSPVTSAARNARRSSCKVQHDFEITSKYLRFIPLSKTGVACSLQHYVKRVITYGDLLRIQNNSKHL